MLIFSQVWGDVRLTRKVLLVDDEKEICFLIEALINWEALDLDLVGRAYDGSSALEMIEQHRPDIVITDIRMPVYDGLELVRRSREQGFSCRFIIISGYRQFEYAQNALRYDVDDYLLKPINADELNATLHSICQKLDVENRLKKEKNNLSEQLNYAMGHLHSRFLTHVLENDLDLSDISEINSAYALQFSDGLFRGVFLKINTAPGTCYGELHGERLLGKVCALCKRFMQQAQLCLVSPEHYGIFVILSYNEDLSSSRLQDLMREINYMTDLFVGCTVTIGVGAEGPLTALPESLHQAMDAARNRLYLGENKVISAESCKYKVNSLDLLVNADDWKDLEDIFDLLDLERFSNWLFTVERRFFRGVNPVLAYKIASQVQEAFLASLMKNEAEIIELSEELAIIGSYIEAAKSTEELFNVLRTNIQRIIEQYTAERELQGRKAIKLAKKYMETNYSEKIHLEDAAAAAHLSASHFAVVFKNEVGLTFAEYLTNYRVEQAKKLLRETDESVGNIATQVGYPDQRYFGKLFQKVAGIKPTDYRKLYGQ